MFRLRSQGFAGPKARYWTEAIDDALNSPDGPSRERVKQLEAWGFTPETVARFRIDKDTLGNFISERDYAFLYPVNGKYSKWVRDRVTARRVFHAAPVGFESIHYHLLSRDGAVGIIPMSDRVEQFPPTVHGIAEAIALLGPLSLTSARWSHSDSAEVAWDGENFTVGDRPFTPAEFALYLEGCVQNEPYVFAEPAREATELARLADGGATVVRLIVVNESGSDPRVTECSVVARDSHGSFEMKVDVRTGTFSEARVLTGSTLEVRREHPQSGVAFSGEVPDWLNLRQMVENMFLQAPQLKFVELEVVRDTDGNTRIVSMSDAPPHSTALPFSSESVRFLEREVSVKRESTVPFSVRSEKWVSNLGRTVRRQWAKAVFPSGLVPYQSVRWIGDIRRDLLASNGVPLRQKLWAYHNGFLSYRIPQYGLTPENREQFISDFEYRWLRHINRDYRDWLEDKISLKHIAAEFNDLMPAYYFHTHAHSGGVQVTALMECEDNGELTLQNVLDQARRVGTVALKPDEGSHGDGFFRLDADRDGYRLNGAQASESDVLGVLSNPSNDYLVTEFISMHPAIARIYPKSVNTVRMIVFRRDDEPPQIGNAYLRIGSERSGYVDNTAQGGLLAEVDIATGRFGNGQMLENGRVVPCPRHPDTGELIEGQLPEWDNVRESVLRIAESLPQLEYFGFDVAITPDGCKIPEVNRFPDYPRIEKLTAETTSYLLGKLEAKKKAYGYDLRRPRSLFGLPRRTGRQEIG